MGNERTPAPVDGPDLAVLKLLLACPDAHIDSDGILLGVYLEQLDGLSPRAISEASRRLRARWESTKPPMPAALRREVFSVLAEWRDAQRREREEAEARRDLLDEPEAERLLAESVEILSQPNVDKFVSFAAEMTLRGARRRLAEIAAERAARSLAAGGVDGVTQGEGKGPGESDRGLGRLREGRREAAGRRDLDREAPESEGDRASIRRLPEGGE